jgi:three-Cys-motif partner protein
MVKTPPPDSDSEPNLPFNIPDRPEPEPLLPAAGLKKRIWTAHKAKLIERYLYYFVLITKHGSYIDGFAGPQYPDRPEMWSANLVLQNEPKRLQHFYLVDKNKNRYKQLERLKAEHPDRGVATYHGDFNVLVHNLLSDNAIKEKEATFCLIDQRTFQCHWDTVRTLAAHKKGKYKIELFYFFANAWFARAVSGFKKNVHVISDWWGRDDWERLLTMSAQRCQEEMVDRFKTELGYKSVKAWPIFERQSGGRTMYFMIHATDHLIAPELMYRAYHKAVTPKEPAEQLRLAFSAAGLSDPLL